MRVGEYFNAHPPVLAYEMSRFWCNCCTWAILAILGHCCCKFRFGLGKLCENCLIFFFTCSLCSQSVGYSRAGEKKNNLRVVPDELPGVK